MPKTSLKSTDTVRKPPAYLLFRFPGSFPFEIIDKNSEAEALDPIRICAQAACSSRGHAAILEDSHWIGAEPGRVNRQIDFALEPFEVEGSESDTLLTLHIRKQKG
jgi:hypothetical protein